jgi:hypothetical protein
MDTNFTLIHDRYFGASPSFEVEENFLHGKMALWLASIVGPESFAILF